MSRPIIACDVDCTIVDTGREHWKWLCEKTVEDNPFPDGVLLPYNLGECFGVPEDEAMDFWRSETLYDELEPIAGCVDVLEHLSKEAEIVFVSQIKGRHTRSKYYFLKKWFPFMAGYVATKEKRFARCDILIDDRLHHLASMPESVKTFLIETPYEQDERYKDFKPTLTFRSWEDIRRKIV